MGSRGAVGCVLPGIAQGRAIIPVLGASAAALGGGHLVTTSSAKQESRWLLALGSPAPHVPRPIRAHWHMGSALAALPWELHSKSIARHPESPGLRIPGASECPGEPPPLLLPSLAPAAPGSAPGHTPQGPGTRDESPVVVPSTGSTVSACTQPSLAAATRQPGTASPTVPNPPSPAPLHWLCLTHCPGPARPTQTGHQRSPGCTGSLPLTLHVVQVSRGQCLRLRLVRRHLLVPVLLSSCHAANAPPLVQVVAPVPWL